MRRRVSSGLSTLEGPFAFRRQTTQDARCVGPF